MLQMPGLIMTHLCSVLLCLLTLSSGTALAAPPEGYNFLSLTAASEQASAANKPMLLYFGRFGCST